jgi:hypothetical protein
VWRESSALQFRGGGRRGEGGFPAQRHPLPRHCAGVPRAGGAVSDPAANWLPLVSQQGNGSVTNTTILQQPLDLTTLAEECVPGTHPCTYRAQLGRPSIHPHPPIHPPMLPIHPCYPSTPPCYPSTHPCTHPCYPPIHPPVHPPMLPTQPSPTHHAPRAPPCARRLKPPLSLLAPPLFFSCPQVQRGRHQLHHRPRTGALLPVRALQPRAHHRRPAARSAVLRVQVSRRVPAGGLRRCGA